MSKSSSSVTSRVREVIATVASRHAVLGVAREFAVTSLGPPPPSPLPSFGRQCTEGIAIPMMDALADDVQVLPLTATTSTETTAATATPPTATTSTETTATTATPPLDLEQLWPAIDVKPPAVAIVVVDQKTVDRRPQPPPSSSSSPPSEYKYLARLNDMGAAASRNYVWYFTAESRHAPAAELTDELRRLFSGDTKIQDAHAFECYDALHSLAPAQLDALYASGRGVTWSQTMGAAFEARPRVLEWVRAHAGPTVQWSSLAIVRNLACALRHAATLSETEVRRKLDDVERCCDLALDPTWPWPNAADRIAFPFAPFVCAADERRSDALVDWALRRAQHRYPIEGVTPQDIESLRDVARRLTDRGQPALADCLLDFIARRTRLVEPLHRAKL